MAQARASGLDYNMDMRSPGPLLAALLFASPSWGMVARVPPGAGRARLAPPMGLPAAVAGPALGGAALSPSLAPAILAANPAPHVRQETEYTCGPACLRSALIARGLEAPPEAELARELGTDERDGTTPEALAEAARRRGLSARAAEHMTLKGLRRALRKGRTVLVNFQSGGEGHWAVVNGAGDGRLLLMDPYEDAFPSALAEDRFLEAWWGFHHGRRYRRAAVVLGP